MRPQVHIETTLTIPALLQRVVGEVVPRRLVEEVKRPELFRLQDWVGWQPLWNEMVPNVKTQTSHQLRRCEKPASAIPHFPCIRAFTHATWQLLATSLGEFGREEVITSGTVCYPTSPAAFAIPSPERGNGVGSQGWAI